MANYQQVNCEIERAKDLATLCLAASERIYGELSANEETLEVFSAIIGNMLGIKHLLANAEGLLAEVHKEAQKEQRRRT